LCPVRDAASRAVFFDLDGTLVDTFQGIADSYRHLLTQLGLGDMDDSELRQFIGPPIQEVLRQSFGLSGGRLEDGIRIFRQHYGAEGLFRFSKYQGVDKMLLDLRSEGFDLYIATSKLQSMAIDIIDHAGWAGVFNVVGGAKQDGTRHLKKDVIAWTLAEVANGADVVAMVGDRAADIVGGREHGLRGIGVTWGYGSAEELDRAGATVTADSPDDLLTALIGLD
jgi:phosphoglycolate phosphatase